MKTIACVPALATALVLLGACASEALAAGATNINNCGVITSPGSYVVTRNLKVSGVCLDVRADYVTIDFDGFAITGDGTGAGVSVQGSGLVVRNGTIAGFGVGISVGVPPGDVVGSVVERMRVIDSANFGIGGGSMVVRDSVLTGNGNTAIALGEASVITGNRVVGNRFGISALEGSTVSGNVVASNTQGGLYVRCPSVVLGNAATSNSVFNMYLSSRDCTVEHNVAP